MGDGDRLVHIEFGIQHHHCRHELGNGSDGRDALGVLAIQHAPGVLIQHHRGTGLQRQPCRQRIVTAADRRGRSPYRQGYDQGQGHGKRSQPTNKSVGQACQQRGWGQRNNRHRHSSSDNRRMIPPDLAKNKKTQEK
jgi:hypothetical protein